MSVISTCGQGLAAHSALHAQIAALLEILGRNLELHVTALDPEDPEAKPEIDAYSSLAAAHRDLVKGLRTVAEEMASHEHLPMPEHDDEALAAPEVTEAFRELIEKQDTLARLLAEWVEEYRGMLEEDPG